MVIHKRMVLKKIYRMLINRNDHILSRQGGVEFMKIHQKLQPIATIPHQKNSKKGVENDLNF